MYRVGGKSILAAWADPDSLATGGEGQPSMHDNLVASYAKAD